ncbi:MAG TPA: tyrosine-type recombinase/integrase [Anaerolineaceae bacterium]|nr:tyrosine-type recombinase/integrase [Anaerolineaceae bacterium]HOR83647.1 tyrosine-type recombinase/integrase [Anaerolineaceae bacterium]HPL43733.1 tyrosine-type recombinase/integrase [Anaerolineaceae bacterium]
MTKKPSPKSPLNLPNLSELPPREPSAPSPAQAYLNTLSPSGRRSQHTALNNLAYIFSGGEMNEALNFPWELLRYEHTSGLAAYMVDIGYAKSSVNKHLVALRRVLAESYQLGLYADHNDYYRAAGVKSLRSETLPRGRTLRMEELRALIRTCLADENNPTLGVRDAAVITVLYAAAVRRQEVVDLNLADLDLKEARIRILGKGSKKRQVYLQADAVGALQNWLDLRGKQLGPLFTRVTKSGRVMFKRLTPQAVYYLLKHRQTQAGLDDFTPHDLRRTSITDLLSAQVDVLTVSAIAGHASADTTRRYDRRSDENKKAAAQRLPSPFADPPSPAENPPRDEEPPA